MERSPIKERKSKSLEEEKTSNTNKFEKLFQLVEEGTDNMSYFDNLKVYQSKFRYLTEYNKKKNDSI